MKTHLTSGEFALIYDPSVGEKEAWYINDHTFIRDETGMWHMFGITHAEPANPLDEKFFAHATAPALMGPWTKQPHVLHADKEQWHETHVWAPYVLRHEGLYWMYYCGGGEDHAAYRIHLATSTDLYHWERHPANPMLIDGFDGRDPMVLRHQGQWLLFYTANSAPAGGHHVVNVVTSSDLCHWSEKREVFRSSQIGTYGGPTESPFVVERNGKFYLFVCTNDPYDTSAAYESGTPFSWKEEDRVGDFPAHAAEVVEDQGKYYISRAGWGQGGLYLAELSGLR